MSGDISKGAWQDRTILEIHVKTRAAVSKIIDWNEVGQFLSVALAAPPLKDKANKELLKLLKKATGKQVKIKSGLTSTTKLVIFV